MRRRSILLSSEFLGLIAGAFCVALVGPLVVALVALGPLERTLIERETRDLVTLTEGLVERRAELLEPEAVARFGNFTDAHLSVLDGQGLVVADSDQQGGTRHEVRRPEIAQAYTSEYGVARRRVSGAGEWLFVARRIEAEELTLGFLQASRPMELVLAPIAPLRRALCIGSALAILAALLGIAWGAWQWFVPIRSLTGFARALARDDKGAVAPVHVGSFGRLGRALLALDKQARRQIAALSKDDAQLRAILTSMVEGILAVDHEDRVVFSNAAARSSLGFERPPENQILWSLAPVVELEDLVRQARTNLRPERREITSLRTGAERTFAMHASPFTGEGQAGVVVVVQDLTELRRLERVRRDFVANVSHELKTPLTAIGGYVDTILEGDVDPDQVQHFLNRVQTNVERLRALVVDLLSLARIESGGAVGVLEPIDWSSVIDDVLRRRTDDARAKELSLERSGASSGRVLGDREAMTQVLENLVGNALHYTPGPGEVRLELTRSRGTVILAVEDTGVGIPDEDQERIFERFYRVDKARSRAVGGTGLGLSIVKNLVLSMNGRVRVSSSLGHGTRFEVEIPSV